MPNNRFTMLLSNIISIKNVYTNPKILYANCPHNVSYKNLISYENVCWFLYKIRVSSSFSNYFRSKSLRYFTTFIIIVVFVQTILVKFLVANIISVISHLIHKSHHRCFIIHHIDCYFIMFYVMSIKTENSFFCV